MSMPLGKLSPEAFDSLIAPHLGATRPEVLVGPRPGTDTAIVKLGAGRVLALTTDPLSIIPSIGVARSAKLAAHLVASDLWTSGIPPAFASVSLQLPPGMSDETLGEYSAALSAAWSELGIAVVTGHTGRYAGLESSVIGAATLLGVGDEGRYVTPSMIASGDRVIVTRGCAIEATAIAAWLVPERLAQYLEPDGVERARALIEQVSVVADCRALTRVGVRDRGISCMHDATEGGVLGGLIEVARASGHDLRIERAKIPLSPEAIAACQAWGEIDPYWTLSEGTLIATVRPEHLDRALAALAEESIEAAEIGEVMPGHGVLHLTEADGSIAKLTRVNSDPYWPAYERALSEGWR
jgi:hydrogenase expression/formation protein HypE